jgi:hypothetical protein
MSCQTAIDIFCVQVSMKFLCSTTAVGRWMGAIRVSSGSLAFGRVVGSNWDNAVCRIFGGCDSRVNNHVTRVRKTRISITEIVDEGEENADTLFQYLVSHDIV